MSKSKITKTLSWSNTNKNTDHYLFIFNWRMTALQYCDGFCLSQNESVMGIHMSPPSWTSLPPHIPSDLPKLTQSTSLGFKSYSKFPFSSVSLLCPTVQPHGPQHARLPCPSPTPGAYSNSCPSSWWCHPTISSSVIPFSSHLQSFPGSGYFPVSHFFTSGSKSIIVSASASVLPMNIQDWFPTDYLFYVWYYCFFLYKALRIQFLANSAIETSRFICIMIFAKFTFLFFNLLKTFRLNIGLINYANTLVSWSF